ncbi:MAG: zinc ribbon domain-containing protein, partial [Deltaproteobacteria bacterium]|nr:zinc ribbon domain-containing protein [Deltaproteobacteria bacterium]
MTVCPNCSKENPDGFRFCQACGTPLASSAPKTADAPEASRSSLICPKCQTENPEGMKFCKGCGTPLAPQSTLPVGANVTPQASSPSAGTAEAPTVDAAVVETAGADPSGSLPAAETPQMAVCSSCGGQTPSGYKFCQHCGAPLPTVQPAGMTSAQSGESQASMSGSVT